jgi:hypothetical protein
MALIFILERVCLIRGRGIPNVLWSILMEEVWVEACVPAVITISGTTVHPLAWILFRNGWYLAVLDIILSSENLSLKFIKSMYWIVISGIGNGGGQRAHKGDNEHIKYIRETTST